MLLRVGNESCCESVARFGGAILSMESERVSFRIGEREVIAGLEYGVEGMRVGGRRRIRVPPHLGYREAGVPGKIPSNASSLL